MGNREICVSVLMCVYNEPKYWLKASINSILSQSHQNFEFIIVNDNPGNKQISQILERIKISDNRIKHVRNSKNLGLTKSLNIGLEIATGKYVVRMDADDISAVDRIEKQLDYMEKNKNVIVCGSNVLLFGDEVKRSKLKTYPNSSRECFDFLHLGSCFAHPSVMIRLQTLINRNLKYAANLKRSQDYELWCRMSKYGDFFNIQEPLLNYRVSKKQISTMNFKEQSLIAKEIRKNFIQKSIKIQMITKAVKENRISFKVVKSSLKYVEFKWASYILFDSMINKNLIHLIYFLISNHKNYPLRYNLRLIKRFFIRPSSDQLFL